jgi:hypothetical protein
MRSLGLVSLLWFWSILLAGIYPFPLTHAEGGSGETFSEVALDALSLVNSCLKRIIFDSLDESFEQTLKRFLAGSPSIVTSIMSRRRWDMSLTKDGLDSLPKHSQCFVTVYFLDPDLIEKTINNRNAIFFPEVYHICSRRLV